MCNMVKSKNLEHIVLENMSQAIAQIISKGVFLNQAKITVMFIISYSTACSAQNVFFRLLGQ